ncbi:FkbM family methyltransferase [Candidatus Uabimicrobium sp. HlEnr_7]|uniref:FkbM family methyltransferase n=1 Tax=Candidatus Uabimicrobium helgolandensis TaxID=3095367 RepID=UPI0035569BF3
MRVFVFKLIVNKVLPFVPLFCRLKLHYLATKIRNDEPELIFLDRIIKSRLDKNAVDIGAHKGLFSYKMSKMFKKVYAFEAQKYLSANLSNSKMKNVEVLNIGLSSKEQQMKLYTPVVGNIVYGNFSSFTNYFEFKCEIKEEVVFVKPLDDLKLENIGFIKIDVEGHEWEVLQGASKTITKNRPELLIEIRDENYEKILDFLSKLEYERFHTDMLDDKMNYIFKPKKNQDPR